MILTPAQSDGLSELVNIAFGRTAAALSDLTGHRVLLEAPRVEVHPVAELGATLGRYVPGVVASVHQDFSGPIAGDALLVLSRADAGALVGLLGDGDRGPVSLDESAREMLNEVGNILLNACLGVLGNMLQVRVTFSAPRLHLDDAEQIVAALANSGASSRHALVVSMAFRIKGSAVAGYVALVLGVASLEALVARVESWEQSTRSESA